jgi:hypothetical protein
VLLKKVGKRKKKKSIKVNVHCCVCMYVSRLRGIMGSVLTIVPKVRGFKPGRGDGIRKVIKIRSTSSFEGEVKRRPHVIRFYSMLRNSTSMKEIFRRQNSSFPSPSSSRIATRRLFW